MYIKMAIGKINKNTFLEDITKVLEDTAVEVFYEDLKKVVHETGETAKAENWIKGTDLYTELALRRYLGRTWQKWNIATYKDDGVSGSCISAVSIYREE